MNKNKQTLSISKKSSKKPLVLALALAALILLTGIAAAYYFKLGPFSLNSQSSINFDKPTEDQLKAGADIKKNTVKQDQDSDKVQPGSDPALAPQPIEGSDKKSIHAEITNTDQDDSSLRIRTLIQTVTNSGMCSLSMTGPDGQTLNFTSDIQALPSSSTCKGFTIPLNQLSPGVWTIHLDFNSSELTASTSKDITVQ